MNQPIESLDDLYRQVARRKARKERAAKVACIVLTTLGSLAFVWCLFTPQP